MSRNTPLQRAAEKAVIRAAYACLDRKGFMYQVNDRGPYPLKIEAMRCLEGALAKLKEAEDMVAGEMDMFERAYRAMLAAAPDSREGKDA